MSDCFCCGKPASVSTCCQNVRICQQCAAAVSRTAKPAVVTVTRCNGGRVAAGRVTFRAFHECR